MRVVVRKAGTGRGVRAALLASALLATPLLMTAPAYADTSSPTPIASETSGGATCLPGTSATCGQDQGVTATPTATRSATPTATATPTAAVTTLPNTGGSRPTSTLAHTGGGAASGWGYTGTGLLVGGTLLVLAASRRRPAQD